MEKNRLYTVSLIIIVVILLVAISAVLLLRNQPASDDGDDFEFLGINGDTKHLSDYRGKYVLMDLWATWCQPCIFQMFELDTAYDAFSGDLIILSINTYDGEDLQDVQTFVNDFPNTYGITPQWTFGKEVDSLSSYNPEESIPRLILFDPQGNNIYQHTGFMPFDTTSPYYQPGSDTLQAILNSYI